MSKKQTRRSISVSGETYDKLQAYVEQHGSSCSGVVEDLLRPFLGLEERAPNLSRPPVKRVERPSAPNRVEQIKEVQASKAREVTVTTPVLEKNGNWEEVDGRKIGPVEPAKPRDPILGDAASKIFTF